MIVKILSTALLGIAALFGLEALNVLPEKKYFPTLPRLEKAENKPENWLSAGQWGLNAVGCMTQGDSLAACTDDNQTASLQDKRAARTPSSSTRASSAPAPETISKDDIVWDEVDTAIGEGSAIDRHSPSFTERVASKS